MRRAACATSRAETGDGQAPKGGSCGTGYFGPMSPLEDRIVPVSGS